MNEERCSNAPLRPPSRIDMNRDLHFLQEQERIKMENAKTDKGLAYDQVSFRDRSGALILAQTGIVFESTEMDDVENGEKPSLSYSVPWHTIRKCRPNGPDEPDALLRLMIAADYGEGDEVETVIFGLSDRKELESLQDDIEGHLRQLENDNSTDTTMSMSFSHGGSSISSISHACSSETMASRHVPIPEEHSSLVLLVYEYLLSASDQTKQAFAEGIVADQPDKVLQAIQQRDRRTSPLSPPSNAVSIFRQTGQEQPNESIVHPQKKLTCVVEDIDSVVDSEEGSAARRERELSRFHSVSAVSMTAEASVTGNEDLASTGRVKEPRSLVGPTRAPHSPKRRNSGGEESRDMIHLAQRLDEQDRQAKQLESNGSAHGGKAGLRRSGRKPCIDDKNGEKVNGQQTMQQEDAQAGKKGQEQRDENYADLKRNILEHLKQQPGASGPGAFSVSDDQGLAAECEACPPPEPEHVVGGINDGLLIEAYLVAQESSVACVPKAPGSQGSAEFEAKPKPFWELTEVEFLDAINRLMKEKVAEPVPAEDIADVVSAVVTRVDNDRKPAATVKQEERAIRPPKMQQMNRPAAIDETQRTPRQAPPTPASNVENEDACCCL